MIAIILGVSGSGKSTVGERLAERLNWAFVEADDFHPPENVAKMARGVGLTDADRAPWLSALHEHLAVLDADGRDAVLACSALKAAYRATLAEGLPVRFVFLSVPQAVLEDRLRNRTGHFAGADLLASQLATLEPPADALRLDGTQPVRILVQSAARAFGG